MDFNELDQNLKAWSLLMTETNKEIAARATETHIKGRIFCITLDTKTTGQDLEVTA